MAKKVQVPVVGGIRKVVSVDAAAAAAGTTIAEFGATVVTLAQLKAALGIVTKPNTVGGSSAGGALVVGPGLSGGGQLVGAVPLQLSAPIPFMMGDDSGGGGDGDPGPPGRDGPAGPTGGLGPMGPAVLFIDEGPEGEQGFPGAPGPSGGPIGPQGPAGAAGASAPIIWLPGEDGQDGDIGPPGPQGAGGGGSSGGNTNPDSHPTSPTAWDDEFEYGTSIDLTGARFAGANGWTWYNQAGVATGNLDQGALQLSSPGVGTATNAWRLVLQAVPAGAWKFRAKLKGLIQGNYQNYGLILYNSGNGKLLNFGPTWNSGALNQTVQEYTNFSTYSNYILLSNSAYLLSAQTAPSYYEIDYDGSSALNFLVSASGYDGDFLSSVTSTVAAFLGGLTHIGLGTNPAYATTCTMWVDWFRRVA